MAKFPILLFVIFLLIFGGCAFNSEPFSQYDPDSSNYRNPSEIQDLQVIDITPTTARVFYKTTESCRGRIQLFQEDDRKINRVIRETTEKELALEHVFELDLLDPGSFYTFKLLNFDDLGREIAAEKTYAFITTKPYVSLFAGSNEYTEKMASDSGIFYADGLKISSHIGLTDGFKQIATFLTPKGMAIDSSSGNIFLADSGNHSIRKLTPQGVTSTVLGGIPFNGLSPAEANRQATQKITLASGTTSTITTEVSYSLLNTPFSITIGKNSEIFVADTGNHRIIMVEGEDITAKIVPIAGTGVAGFTNGTGLASQFYYPLSLVYNPKDHSLYVADTYNYAIRKIDLTTFEVSVAAGTGVPGFQDGNAVRAQFVFPTDMDVDGQGNIYIADVSRIRMLSADGQVSTVVGNLRLSEPGSVEISPLDSNALTSGFGKLTGISVDSTGNIYIADANNKKIRKYDSLLRKTTTLFGMASTTYTLATGTILLTASGTTSSSTASGTIIGNFPNLNLTSPYDLVFDKQGNLIIGDEKSNEIYSLHPF
ncbi:hypothetical protein ACFL35_18975 [Candidatus Riflebacteria bacterium]